MNDKTDAIGEVKPATTTDAAKAAEAQGIEEETNDVLAPDIDIIDPAPIPIQIAGREYKIGPTPIHKMRRISELTKLEANLMTENESADKMLEIVCDLIGSPNDEHIKKNLNKYDVTRIFRAILAINTKGAKPKKKAD